ncbi:MAG: ParB/RepB/Spo0J family partition protein [Desulfovibrionaceae bacterium]|nr:ParB/RepB/Spo0J family partition protein [Desulfovibrionaceae bacterium]MBF0512607.1 ParB/RepB/Spo0J family partition protein [Desulfovibrionaceae bacterium]
MAGPRGLGRGLDALIRQTNVEERASEARLIPLARIRVNPYQPRTVFSDDSLAELADSIKAQGVLQPILAREISTDPNADYELVAGERRLRAARLAGLTQIPAVIRELTDEQSLVIALIENLQRENLNPVDEATGLSRLRDMLSLSQEDIARRVGKSRAAVANALRLLQLPPDVLADVASGALSAGHARALLAVSEETPRSALHRVILEKGLSVREAETMAVCFKLNGKFPEGLESALQELAPIEPGAPAVQTRAAKIEKPVDERLAAFQDKLRDHLGHAVEIKGLLERGRIVIKYAGKQALGEILERITGETS